jgi:hypothetical protein
MTADDLEAIEHALGFSLPLFYKRFMQDYPCGLRERQADWLKPVSEWEFANSPDRVIAFNRFVRAQEEGYFVDDGLWPDSCLVIGNEEDQNYFAIDRLDGKETVYFWSHEDGEFHPIAESLSGYVEWLIEWWDDIKRRNAE